MTPSPTTATDRKADSIVLMAVLLVVLVFFGKTVFLGMPISKIARLNEWDSLFSAYWTGQGGLCDPSLVQLLVPYYNVVAHLWHSGQIPLWNPYCGFGVPLVADVQATVFSPVRLLFNLFPNMYVYNLTLVLEVAFSATGTYLLARTLKAGIWAAVFAAFAYALCPYNLYYLEQLSGVSHCLFPGLLWLFARLAREPGPGRAAWAGVGCASLILSGHPESSLFGVGWATLLYVGLLFADRDSGMSLRLRAISCCRYLTGAALVAFALSAPVLLPFLEYLNNSDCYKFGVAVSAFIPWRAVVYDLVQPGFGPASPYLGVVASTLFPVGLLTALRGNRTAALVAGLGLLAFCLISRLWVFHDLLQIKPFTYIITVYCMPVFLLMVALLSALAFDRLTDRSGTVRPDRFDWLALVLAAGAIVAVPPALAAAHADLSAGDFDSMIPHMAVSLISWKRDLVLLALWAIVIGIGLGGGKIWKRCPSWLTPVVAIAVSMVSIAYVSRGALPIQNKFSYPMVEPIRFLQDRKARFVALGEHLFKPNTGAVYGVNDIRTHNPLFPKRYLSFMEWAGAKVDMFNQVFERRPERILDAAAVRYLLALTDDDQRAGLGSVGSLKLVATAMPQRIAVYENTRATHRAYFVRDYVIADSPAAAINAMLAPSFDPEKVAVLEGVPAGFRRQSAPTLPEATVRMEGGRETEVRISVEAPAAGYLILADTYYPGWRALVDGKETRILRANFLFRAVELPAGTHEVVFEYRPFSFWLGAILAAICIAFLSIRAGLAIWRPAHCPAASLAESVHEESCR